MNKYAYVKSVEDYKYGQFFNMSNFHVSFYQ